MPRLLLLKPRLGLYERTVLLVTNKCPSVISKVVEVIHELPIEIADVLLHLQVVRDLILNDCLLPGFLLFLLGLINL